MIALGSHVTFTHRAGVGRRKRKSFGKEEPAWSDWDLTEPKVKLYVNGKGVQILTSATPMTFVSATELIERPETIREERWDVRNKTLFHWPQEGSGVVVGEIRKQYGISHGASGGANVFGEGDWDPGFFEPFGQVSLYVVKAELRGAEVYVPQAAMHLIHHDA